jgi:hypothetical protein
MFSGCASIQAPAGGEKDTLAPRLVMSIPKSGSTNFRSLSLRLVFDEYITAQDLKKELIITPTPPGEYAVRSRAEVLTLVFDKPFDDSTTYSFNFRKGIKDVTEKNPVKDLRLSFSTGEKIDSLSLKGRVFHALDLQAPKTCLVMLYADNDTLDFPTHKPLYLTQTDEKGYFEFFFLPAKRFKVYALSGTSTQYNRREQLVGFCETPVRADSVKNLEIKVLDYDFKPFVLMRQKTWGNNFEIQFNKTPLAFSLEIPRAYDSIISYVVDKNRVVFYPLYQGFSDSLLCKFTAIDSVGNVLDSASMLRFDGKAKAKREKWVATVSQRLDLVAGDSINLQVHLNQPFGQFFADSVEYLVESDSVPKKTQIQTLNRQTLVSIQSLPVHSKHSIRLKKGCLISLLGDTLPEQVFHLSARKERDFGIVSGKIITQEKNYTLQLLGEKGLIEAELFAPKEFKFEYVKPGKKKLRVLLDSNADGQWDRGDLKSRRPPEPAFLLEKELIIKANWELSENIITF